MRDRSKQSMLEAIQQVISSFPKRAFQSIPSDRGKEFSCFQEVEKLGIPFYFVDPYCAWQRGSNKNSNSLLREFFPKKIDLGKVSTDKLLSALFL